MSGIIISFLAGLISGVLGNYFYDKLRFKFRPKKKDFLPTILKDENSWINSNGELYSYEKDPNFTIKINEGEDVLSGRFKKFPDREHDRVSWVEVKYNQANLFGWNFMYLDGYRYLVPVPKTETDAEGKSYDFYDLNSMEVKVFKVIGQANLMGEATKIEGLKNIAKMLGITMTEL